MIDNCGSMCWILLAIGGTICWKLVDTSSRSWPMHVVDPSGESWCIQVVDQTDGYQWWILVDPISGSWLTSVMDLGGS